MTFDDNRPSILSIDQGLHGDVAWLFPDHSEVQVTPTLPKGKFSKRQFDVAEMVELLRAHLVDLSLSVLETVSAAPVAGLVQGTTSMFNFDPGVGLWEGILAGLAIPRQFVLPKTWKKVVLAGTARGKPAAIAFAQARYHGV